MFGQQKDLSYATVFFTNKSIKVYFCCMHLLLCSATEFEISPLMKVISKYKGLEILITGVGLTAATFAITKKVLEKKPGLIIPAGVAGNLDHLMGLTKVVWVKTETIGDLGVEENGRFHSLSDLDLQDKNQFPWKNGVLYNERQIEEQAIPAVHGVTVNEISTDHDRINYYRDVLGAQIETMEGAALHYVALMENIPFLQLRSLSNFVAQRDKSKWMMKESIERLNTELERILDKYLNK